MEGAEDKKTIVIAARVTLFESIVLLHSEVLHERPDAATRLLICKATLRQPIGNLGKELVVCGMHGHNKTMKHTWAGTYKSTWDRVCHLLKVHDVDLFTGDYNMGMMQVPNELSCRELKCDVLAYYPFVDNSVIANDDHKLALDSMAMFWIGGDVEGRLNWPVSHIERLKNAGKRSITNDWNVPLDTYIGQDDVPGYSWHSYRCTQRCNEGPIHKNLEAALRVFLTPTTPSTTWEERKARGGGITWLRFQQKAPAKEAFLVNGRVHPGAHMPLLVFTHNPQSHRSANWESQRRQSRATRMKSCAPALADQACRRGQTSASAWAYTTDTDYVVDRISQCSWNGARQCDDHQWNDHQWNPNAWMNFDSWKSYYGQHLR